MSTFGPLQKLSFTLVASGALMRICTRPPSSTRGYSAPQTLVSAGLKLSAPWAKPSVAVRHNANAIAVFFIGIPSSR